MSPMRPAIVRAGGAVLFGAVVFCLGYSRLELMPTDPVSEKVALDVARQLAAGDIRGGLFRPRQTHYPDGPAFLIAPVLALGWEGHVRTVPLALSAAAFAFLLYVLLEVSRTLGLAAWSVISSAVLAIQPGLLNWYGALHEHSYIISATLAGLALSACLDSRLTWLFFVFGFISAWLGYDLLLIQAIGTFTIRLLYYHREGQSSRLAVFARSTYDTVKLVSGVAAALLTQMLQNAVYLGGFATAVHDLLGAGAARMGSLETAAGLNPEFSSFIRRAAGSYVPPRADLVARYFQVFFSHCTAGQRVESCSWSAPELLVATGGVGIVLGTAGAVRRLVRGKTNARVLAVEVCLTALAVLLTALGSVLWIVAMPLHARFHFHFLPRHILASLTTVAVIPPMLYSSSPLLAIRSHPNGRSHLPIALLAYGLPVMVLLAVCGDAYFRP